MNGARGVVVAIMRGTDAPGSASGGHADRTDGSAIAGTGIPGSKHGSLPRGEGAFPVPEHRALPRVQGPCTLSRSAQDLGAGSLRGGAK
eukprot:6154334-Pyramimonas_sp.AAC.1